MGGDSYDDAYHEDDPQHECYIFSKPKPFDKYGGLLPSTRSCKEPCGVEYTKHGRRCQYSVHVSVINPPANLNSITAETPGLIEVDYTCVSTIEFDIDQETSCSDYRYDSLEYRGTRACVCEGELCNIPDYGNGTNLTPSIKIQHRVTAQYFKSHTRINAVLS